MSRADSDQDRPYPPDAWPGLDRDHLPRHIAIIMDGNGRWAKGRGLTRLKGHHQGAESVRVVVTTARKLGLKALTLYAFSTENWGRPKTEVSGLMELLKRFLKKEEQGLLKRDIRLTTIGQRNRLPGSVSTLLNRVMKTTADCQGMILNLALSYGSRDEILAAAIGLARNCRDGALQPEDIDEQLFESRLQTADLPPVDLMIRTSGEMRLSNFLLWQCAYAELVFTPTRWPDFREEELVEAIIEYQKRDRRFGLTEAQTAKGGS